MIRVAWLPGDGVGREVTEGAVRLLDAFAPPGAVLIEGPLPIGATAIAETGDDLPAETLEACRRADAILFGAVGEDPSVPTSLCPRPERALLRLRRELDLAISVRELLDPTTGETTTIVRNLLEGSYVDDRHRLESDGVGVAVDELRLHPDAIAAVAALACERARRTPGRRFVSADKASVYATSRLWRRVVGEVATLAGVEVQHLYVDRAAFELASERPLPAVIVTEGLFGDILSDLISGRIGTPALCGSASLPSDTKVGCQGLFEPAHGSAPRRARTDMVNPSGAFLAVAMLLERFPDTAVLGGQVRRALDEQLRDGPLTYDLAASSTPIGTRDFADRILARIDTRIPSAGSRIHDVPERTR